jgi:hypothetical protein
MKPVGPDGGMIEAHERRRRAGDAPTDCGWTWREESAVPFGGGSYEIRIKGRLSDSLLAAFEGLTASVEPVETVLHGPVLDQIQSLGLELVEIRRLPTPSDEPADELAAESEPPP